MEKEYFDERIRGLETRVFDKIDSLEKQLVQRMDLELAAVRKTEKTESNILNTLISTLVTKESLAEELSKVMDNIQPLKNRNIFYAAREKGIGMILMIGLNIAVLILLIIRTF